MECRSIALWSTKSFLRFYQPKSKILTPDDDIDVIDKVAEEYLLLLCNMPRNGPSFLCTF